MKKTRKIKVIGAGGIGSYFIEPMARYLSHSEDDVEITIIDGDTYEDRNRERQCFSELGNKAEVTVRDLQLKFPKIHFKAKPEYISKSNVISSIRDGDEVFLCVDNHNTRRTVSRRCEELDNIALFSGGNEYTDGDVNVYIRKDGKDGKEFNRPMTALFPKIAEPEDQNPGDLTEEERQGCEQEAQTNPQLLFTNLAIASHMCNCYYAYEQGKLNFERVCVDILTQCARTKPEKGF